MSNPTIAVLHRTGAVSWEELQAHVAALQVQVTRDFAPVYGLDATLIAVPKGTNPPPLAWWIAYMDNSDQQGALGLHDETPAGLPIGKVFAQTDLDNGASVSVTASHEVLEMLGDPDLNKTVVGPDPHHVSRRVRWSYEVGDPVESDDLGYRINGVLVSDFILPAWFERNSKGPFDFKQHLHKPFSLAAGGYASYRQNGQWHQVEARLTYEALPKVGSRRERRSRDRSRWLKSVISVISDQ